MTKVSLNAIFSRCSFFPMSEMSLLPRLERLQRVGQGICFERARLRFPHFNKAAAGQAIRRRGWVMERFFWGFFISPFTVPARSFVDEVLPSVRAD